jgi:aminomethyltransferase
MLVGIVIAGRVVPRQGYTLFHGETAVGTVTSGVFSPQRACGIGLAYLTREYGRPGALLELEVRGARHDALIVSRRDMLVHTPMA